jgi:hypothetical protein
MLHVWLYGISSPPPPAPPQYQILNFTKFLPLKRQLLSMRASSIEPRCYHRAVNNHNEHQRGFLHACIHPTQQQRSQPLSFFFATTKLILLCNFALVRLYTCQHVSRYEVLMFAMMVLG